MIEKKNFEWVESLYLNYHLVLHEILSLEEALEIKFYTQKDLISDTNTTINTDVEKKEEERKKWKNEMKQRVKNLRIKNFQNLVQALIENRSDKCFDQENKICNSGQKLLDKGIQI